MRRGDWMTRSTHLLSRLGCACCLAWPACSRDEAPAPPPGTAAPASAPAATEPAGADAQDDRQAPRALPDTGEMPGWIKIDPIRRVQPDQLLRSLADPAVARALRTFPVDRVWTCAYTLHDGRGDVMLFETADPLDAFGLFSVLTHQGGIEVRPLDGMMLETAPSPQGEVITGWQGRVCLRIEASGFRNEKTRQSAGQLARRTLFSVPSADPPFIMRAIPRAMRLDGKVWMVRRTAALGITLEELKRVAAAGLDLTLGMTGREKLWVAAVGDRADTQPGASRPAQAVSAKHLLWIAEYTSEGDARGAFDRYKRQVEKASTELDRETRICEPRGRYLAGTWTAGAEDAEPLLPALLDMLPTGPDELASHSLGPTAAHRPASVPH